MMLGICTFEFALVNIAQIVVFFEGKKASERNIVVIAMVSY